MNEQARTGGPARTEPRADDPWHRAWSIRGAIRVAVGVLAVAAAALALWWTRNVVLLIFAGMLLGVVLHGASDRVARLARLPRGLALAAVVAVVAALLGAAGWWGGPLLAPQLQQLVSSLGQTLSDVSQWLTGGTGDDIMRDLDLEQVTELLPSPWGIASGATALAGGIAGALASVAIVVFLGIYLAADPGTYTGLAMRLAPARRRREVGEMLAEAGAELRGWLKGQGVSMLAVGLTTYLGLLLLGMPLALVLALFAALTGFIPYIGPIIAGVAMVLVAFGESATMALWVFGLYVLIQALESYILSPLIQARAVHLPPVVVIVSQLVFGALFGVLGVMLATPMAAVATVPLRRMFPKPGRN